MAVRPSISPAVVSVACVQVLQRGRHGSVPNQSLILSRSSDSDVLRRLLLWNRRLLLLLTRMDLSFAPLAFLGELLVAMFVPSKDYLVGE